jgi:hypothetical protein
MSLNILLFRFGLFLVSRANGLPPLYCGLIESDSSPSFLIPSDPILSFPNALSCVFLSVIFSSGRPKSASSSYPTGTFVASYLPLPYRAARSCGVP